MSEITLYTNPMSRGRIARWMLEELGEPYRAEVLTYAAVKEPAYKAINPMGKVPAIRHGATVVTENAAIATYLAAAFPAKNLQPPPGTPESAAYYRWTFFAAGPVEAAITNRAFGCEPPADKSRAVGYGTFADAMDVLETAVSATPYIAGDRFTAADVIVGSQVMYGLQFGTIDKRPAFQAYWDRLKDRPAFLRAAEMDDAAAAEMQAG